MSELFMNEIFNNTTATGSARSLPGTTELTALASSLSSQIIKAMDADIETYRPRIAQSATDNAAMDTLIDELIAEYGDQADFLLDLDEATINNMLKSQQSKRSRSKSKQMTVTNYQTIMTAAIAERIIREKTGKTKSAGHIGRAAAAVDYTIEELEMLSNNPDELKKAIRNVQSKKSIMKSKADFDKSSERWQSLLRVEQQLKNLRGNTPAYTVEVEVDYTEQYIKSLFENLDENAIKHMKADAMRAMLTSIYNTVVIGGNEVPNDEEA